MPTSRSAARRRLWLRRFHLVRVGVWGVQIPIALATRLKSSLGYIVFLSLAALVEGAASSYMAARAEESAS